MNEINKDQRSLPDYAYEIEMLKRAGKRVCTMPYQGAWCNDCKQFCTATSWTEGSIIKLLRRKK